MPTVQESKSLDDGSFKSPQFVKCIFRINDFRQDEKGKLFTLKYCLIDNTHKLFAKTDAFILFTNVDAFAFLRAQKYEPKVCKKYEL